MSICGNMCFLLSIGKGAVIDQRLNKMTLVSNCSFSSYSFIEISLPAFHDTVYVIFSHVLYMLFYSIIEIFQFLRQLRVSFL